MNPGGSAHSYQADRVHIQGLKGCDARWSYFDFRLNFSLLAEKSKAVGGSSCGTLEIRHRLIFHSLET